MTPNLFSDLAPPLKLTDELVDLLVTDEAVRIERIVSSGQSSPDGFWYDNDQAEWVVVLKGEAKLQFEGDEAAMHMEPGDHVNIPAHRRHRVAWTSPTEPTVWLAVYYRPHENARRPADA